MTNEQIAARLRELAGQATDENLYDAMIGIADEMVLPGCSNQDPCRPAQCRAEGDERVRPAPSMDALRGLTTPHEMLAAISGKKIHCAAQPAGDAGMPVVAMPSDDEMLMAFHSFDWGSVPHQFRGSVGMERGIRWLLDSFGHLVRQRDAQAAIAARDARIAELEADSAHAWPDDGIQVQLADGTITHKPFDELRPDDRVVFDGPDTQAALDASRARFEAEIEAAGGLEAWRAQPAGWHGHVLAIMKLVEQYGGKRSELAACQIIGGLDTQFQVAQECSNLHNQIHDALCALVKSAAVDAARECAEEIHSLIKDGPLQGNGWDEVAERNGLILAANAIHKKFGVQS